MKHLLLFVALSTSLWSQSSAQNGLRASLETNVSRRLVEGCGTDGSTCTEGYCNDKNQQKTCDKFEKDLDKGKVSSCELPCTAALPGTTGNTDDVPPTCRSVAAPGTESPNGCPSNGCYKDTKGKEVACNAGKFAKDLAKGKVAECLEACSTGNSPEPAGTPPEGCENNQCPVGGCYKDTKGKEVACNAGKFAKDLAKNKVARCFDSEAAECGNREPQGGGPPEGGGPLPGGDDGSSLYCPSNTKIADRSTPNACDEGVDTDGDGVADQFSIEVIFEGLDAVANDGTTGEFPTEIDISCTGYEDDGTGVTTTYEGYYVCFETNPEKVYPRTVCVKKDTAPPAQSWCGWCCLAEVDPVTGLVPTESVDDGTNTGTSETVPILNEPPQTDVNTACPTTSTCFTEDDGTLTEPDGIEMCVNNGGKPGKDKFKDQCVKPGEESDHFLRQFYLSACGTCADLCESLTENKPGGCPCTICADECASGKGKCKNDECFCK